MKNFFKLLFVVLLSLPVWVHADDDVIVAPIPKGVTLSTITVPQKCEISAEHLKVPGDKVAVVGRWEVHNGFAESVDTNGYIEFDLESICSGWENVFSLGEADDMKENVHFVLVMKWNDVYAAGRKSINNMLLTFKGDPNPSGDFDAVTETSTACCEAVDGNYETEIDLSQVALMLEGLSALRISYSGSSVAPLMFDSLELQVLPVSNEDGNTE